jgi:hypothetical protein
MKFNKVNLEHINLAIEDFKEKGFPKGFKQSAYFDVNIDLAKFKTGNVKVCEKPDCRLYLRVNDQMIYKIV